MEFSENELYYSKEETISDSNSPLLTLKRERRSTEDEGDDPSSSGE